jgi:iron(III) transport system ATP-binding protein
VVVSGPNFTAAPEKRSVGLVFQDYALFPHLRVEDNIAFGLRHLGVAERTARVREMIDLVGLVKQAARYPHELSGGQQQRVALARALAPGPALLLMDEPFSSLDVELRARLGAEVRQILKASRTTAILVTHDQQEAFAMADRVGVMHAGRLEQWDRPYELYHRPATRYVADFIGQGVFLPAKVITPLNVEIELGRVERTRCRCLARSAVTPAAKGATSKSCCAPTTSCTMMRAR